MPTFDSQVKFQKIPVSQLVVEQAATASAPTSPLVGQLWFDTTVNQLKVCTNATGPVWTQCDNVVGGTAGNVADGDKGDITISSGVWTIDNGVVTLGKLAADSVDSSKIVNNSIASGDLLLRTLVEGNMSLAILDPVAGNYGLRTLGTSGVQACAGNDARLSDARPPAGAITGDLAGSIWPALNLANGSVDLAGSEVANTLPFARGGTGNPSGYSGPGCVIYQNTATGFGGTAIGSTGQVLQSNGAGIPSWVTPTALVGLRLDTIAAPTSLVSFNGQRATLMSDPVNPTDGANKLYVDTVAQGLDAKLSVRGRVTSAPGSWSGTQWTGVATAAALDNITPSVGDRFLIDLGTNSSGIFTWQAGDLLVRANDFDNWNEIPGAFVFVEQGTSDNNGYTCTNNPGGTLNTTAITWTQFSGAGQIVDGIGLLKTGNTLDVRLDNTTIEAPSDILQVKASGITSTQLSPASVDSSKLAVGAVDLATTKVTGILGTAKGGTGADASTAGGQANARANLGALGSYATNSPALTAGTWATITHNLQARARHVSFEEVSSGEGRILDWRVNSTNPNTQVDIRCDIVGGRAISYYNVNVAC
jgi:hypothetical protein